MMTKLCIFSLFWRTFTPSQAKLLIQSNSIREHLVYMREKERKKIVARCSCVYRIGHLIVNAVRTQWKVDVAETWNVSKQTNQLYSTLSVLGAWWFRYAFALHSFSHFLMLKCCCWSVEEGVKRLKRDSVEMEEKHLRPIKMSATYVSFWKCWRI